MVILLFIFNWTRQLGVFSGPGWSGVQTPVDAFCDFVIFIKTKLPVICNAILKGERSILENGMAKTTPLG